MRRRIAVAGHLIHSLLAVLPRKGQSALNKTTVAIFAVGAAAGWTIAQRVSTNGQLRPTNAAGGEPPLGDAHQPAPLAAAHSRGEELGTDPFSGAFKAARAEVNSHANDQADQPDRRFRRTA
jgi:hypothetical protein